MPRVVIDAMGGDLGLAVNIEGVAQLSLEDDNIQMVLVGDVGQVTGALSEHRHNPRKIQVRHAGPAVAMADDLSAGLDPNCSIAVAMAALAGGQGEALVSADTPGPRFWLRASTWSVFQASAEPLWLLCIRLSVVMVPKATLSPFYSMWVRP